MTEESEIKTRSGVASYSLPHDVKAVFVDNGTELVELMMLSADENSEMLQGTGFPKRCQVVGRELRISPVPDAEYWLALIPSAA
jgi:hypothetical protein